MTFSISHWFNGPGGDAQMRVLRVYYASGELMII